MKLLYCPHCGDIVRLYPEKRTCLCGKSWGQYLEDGATTVQTYPSISVNIINSDFSSAINTFVEQPRAFAPTLVIRGWINPLNQADVTFVQGEALEEENDDAEVSEEIEQAQSVQHQNRTEGAVVE